MNLYQLIPYRGKHLQGGFSPKSNRTPTDSLTSSGQMKFIFRLMAMLISITVTFGRRLIYREYIQKPFHPPKVTVWYDFTDSFILVLSFFETQCAVKGRKTALGNAQHYLMVHRENVVPNIWVKEMCFLPRLCKIEYLLTLLLLPRNSWYRFEKDKIIEKSCRFPWPPRSSDLIPAVLD